MATPISQGALNDKFSVTVRNLSTVGFNVIVYRLEGIDGWDQQVRVHWIAIDASEQ